MWACVLGFDFHFMFSSFFPLYLNVYFFAVLFSTCYLCISFLLFVSYVPNPFIFLCRLFLFWYIFHFILLSWSLPFSLCSFTFIFLLFSSLCPLLSHSSTFILFIFVMSIYHSLSPYSYIILHQFLSVSLFLFSFLFICYSPVSVFRHPPLNHVIPLSQSLYLHNLFQQNPFEIGLWCRVIL